MGPMGAHGAQGGPGGPRGPRGPMGAQGAHGGPMGPQGLKSGSDEHWEPGTPGRTSEAIFVTKQVGKAPFGLPCPDSYTGFHAGSF